MNTHKLFCKCFYKNQSSVHLWIYMLTFDDDVIRCYLIYT